MSRLAEPLRNNALGETAFRAINLVASLEVLPSGKPFANAQLPRLLSCPYQDLSQLPENRNFGSLEKLFIRLPSRRYVVEGKPEDEDSAAELSQVSANSESHHSSVSSLQATFEAEGSPV